MRADEVHPAAPQDDLAARWAWIRPFMLQIFAGSCLFTAASGSSVVFAVLEREPEETSVYAAHSAAVFAGTLGLRRAHCCNFPTQAAEKNMSLC